MLMRRHNFEWCPMPIKQFSQAQINCLLLKTAGCFICLQFLVMSAILKLRPHCAEGIWKRRFHSENVPNAFRPRYAGGISKRTNHRSFWICVWGKLGQGNHVIIGTPSFSKNLVFKMFSIYTKVKSRRFQIPPVWRAFSKSSFFVTD